VNLIDTAEIYGFGRSEEIVGRALRTGREKAFVATKIFPLLPVGPLVVNSAKASLKRLGTGTIDLYQIHQPNPVVPLATTMAGMRHLVSKGLVKNVGVSNYSLKRWQAAEKEYRGVVLSNQVRYNLIDRGPERGLLQWAQANDHLIIAYSPLAQGLLSGRYDRNNRPKDLVRSTSSAFLPENLDKAEPLLSELRRVASAHQATSSQVALAWLLRRPNVVVIPGASSVAQLETNVAAADLELTDSEDEALTAASDAYHPLTGPASLPSLVTDRIRHIRPG
jgi:aryl-alcohol dehydrogenase-like predicted oxidoreductase